jgi:hypothetical protein
VNLSSEYLHRGTRSYPRTGGVLHAVLILHQVGAQRNLEGCGVCKVRPSVDAGIADFVPARDFFCKGSAASQRTTFAIFFDDGRVMRLDLGGCGACKVRPAVDAGIVDVPPSPKLGRTRGTRRKANLRREL